MKNIVIFAANGQIAQLVTKRVLTEAEFEDVNLTLALRHSDRLSELTKNPRVRLVEADLTKLSDVKKAVINQDLVFVAVVDHSADASETQNIITAMQAENVKRVIYTNILGIYDEVPGEFGRWNKAQVSSGLATCKKSDALLAASGLDYTTLRLPWLNDRDEIKYSVTGKNESYVGVSASRQSVADLVLKIIANPDLGKNDSLGLADPDTAGLARPVY
jgi:uncharacterized protein YbjT (DUF2867 family)